MTKKSKIELKKQSPLPVSPTIMLNTDSIQNLIKTEDMLDETDSYRSPSQRKIIPLTIVDGRKQVVMSQQNHTEFMETPTVEQMNIQARDRGMT